MVRSDKAALRLIFELQGGRIFTEELAYLLGLMSEHFLRRSHTIQLLTPYFVSLRFDELPHAIVKDGARLPDAQDLASSDFA